MNDQLMAVSAQDSSWATLYRQQMDDLVSFLPAATPAEAKKLKREIKRLEEKIAAVKA